MTESQGRILNIERDQLGSELVADIPIGTTVINLKSLVDFSEEGTLIIGSEVLEYSEIDEDARTITLDTATTALHAEDDSVFVYPLATELWAHVNVDDVQEDEPLMALIPHSLRGLLPEGLRAIGDQESVSINQVDGIWMVTNILGEDVGLVGPSIDIPGIDEAGFHVDSEGNLSLGGTTADDTTQGWSITSLSGVWTTIQGNISGVDSGALVQAFGAGTDATRLQALILISPFDSDLNPSMIRLLTSPTDGSQVELTGDTVLMDSLIVGKWIDLPTRTVVPGAPDPGFLRVYVFEDNVGNPQLRVKNSAGSVRVLTDFTDGA